MKVISESRPTHQIKYHFLFIYDHIKIKYHFLFIYDHIKILCIRFYLTLIIMMYLTSC